MNVIYLYLFSINFLLSSASFYTYDKNVVELNQTTFRDFIFNKDYAILVEFYNSFCGACRRYSGTWKSLGLDIKTWNDIIKITGIDCSENDELCRDHEIQYFPSIRYFSPYLKDDPEQQYIGQQSSAKDVNGMKTLIVDHLRNETVYPKHWPNLMPIVNSIELKDLFANVSDHVKHIILVYPSVIFDIGYKLALDYHNVKEVLIKQIDSKEIMEKLGIDIESMIHVIGRDLKVHNLFVGAYYRHQAIRNILEKYFSEHSIKFEKIIDQSIVSNVTDDNTLTNDEKMVLSKIKQMKDKVFQADLEKALKQSLTIDVYNKREIEGDNIKALRKYISVVQKYSPLGTKGQTFFEELVKFLNESDTIDGAKYKLRIDELMNKADFAADRWIGCQGSSTNLRGYSCGLWTLFHYLTIRSASSNESTDNPIEVLDAIHDYVTHFFGCTECADHFHEMAVDNRMWNVTNNNQTILWLWKAHNKVNDRLSGDITEDPMFPKMKFPSYSSCPNCRAGFDFNENDVLAFLFQIYSNKNISVYGIGELEREEYITPQSMLDFHDDMESGNLERVFFIFSIGFCVCVMLLIFYLFFPKKSNNEQISNLDDLI